MITILSTLDTPSDLLQIYPQPNNTFRIKIKNKCLQLTSIDLYLYVFDLSIINQIHDKELDQLDPHKYDSLKVNRSYVTYSLAHSSNFNLNSRFKFAIAFTAEAGAIDLALHPKVFNCKFVVIYIKT